MLVEEKYQNIVKSIMELKDRNTNELIYKKIFVEIKKKPYTIIILSKKYRKGREGRVIPMFHCPECGAMFNPDKALARNGVLIYIKKGDVKPARLCLSCTKEFIRDYGLFTFIEYYVSEMVKELSQ